MPAPTAARRGANPQMMRRVAGLFRPHARDAVLVGVAVLVSVVFSIAPPFFFQRIVDQGLLKHDLGVVVWDSIAVAACVLAAMGFTLLYGYLSVVMGQKIMCEIRQALFEHLQKMSLRFFTHARTGDIQTRLIGDVAGVQTVVSNTFTDQLSNVVIVLSSVAAMFAMDWRLTLLSILMVPFIMGVGRSVGAYARTVRKGTQEQTSELNSMMQETLSVSGILLSKTAGNQDVLRSRFQAENLGLAQWQIKASVIQYLFFGMIRLVTQFAPALVYLLAGWLLVRQGDESVTVGKLVAFTGLQTRMFFPLTGLLSAQVEILSSFALFERIFEYLDMPVDIADRPGARAIAAASVGGRVEFRDVRFKYEDAQARWTLDDITFTAEPGQLVALVGPSGAGKTTITYLIPRLYDPAEGAVLLDGTDIRDITMASLGTAIGAVTQETYLMHTTIRENLRVVRPEATDADLEAACRAAAIHEHIASLPKGYDTVVGERGYKLSGGEKQRIGIARVILKNPKVLILDEATSALDTQSERLIQASLQDLMASRTTFAIAHRLSTVLSADLILVIKDGRIVERGKHDDLLALDGVYRALYDEQFRGVATAAPALP